MKSNRLLLAGAALCVTLMLAPTVASATKIEWITGFRARGTPAATTGSG